MTKPMDLAALSAAVQKLQDIHEIQTVKYRYFRCIDTANHEELRTCFHPDVTTEFLSPDYEIRLAGADAYVNFIRDTLHAGIVCHHTGHHPEITIESDTEASGKWYLYDVFIDLAAKRKMDGTAIYIDKYKKHNGQWTIFRTTYERIYEISETFTEPPHLTAHMLGKRGFKYKGPAPVLQEAFQPK